MQQDAGELSRKLLRSLDDAYNVIDMPAVLEVISVLEKISISKELLQSSRLGKYVNEVRRNTTDDQLAKRTRDLVKKWRNEFIAESNGQLKPSEAPKRLTSSTTANQKEAKRPRLNGNNELDLSDNSNSSFKDALVELARKENVILVNSDSNSSDVIKQDVGKDVNKDVGSKDVVKNVIKQELTSEQQMAAFPKKRGRKKGSKNHKSLLDEAETSFSNKMAVSRGNAKVKTTQELVASLQSRNNVALGLSGKVKEDLNEKAAKLTERVSIIDQKLYNTSPNHFFRRKKKVFESGTKDDVIKKEDFIKKEGKVKDEIKIKDEIKEEDEIIIIDEDKLADQQKNQSEKIEKMENLPIKRALSIEEALNLLPPVKPEDLNLDSSPVCTCKLNDETSEYLEDASCPAKIDLNAKYDLDNISEEKINTFLSCYVPNLNGNEGLGVGIKGEEASEDGLYKNVVPNRVSERLPKRSGKILDWRDAEGGFSDDLKRYRISEGAPESFREWHEVVEAKSYDGEVIRILPYVVID